MENRFIGFRFTRKEISNIMEDLKIEEKKNISGRAIDRVAKKHNVSGRQIDKIRKIERIGSPEIKRKFRDGKISINTAYNIIMKKQRTVSKKPIPKGKYNVIYINTPWHKMSLENVENALFSDDTLKTLVVKDSVIFIWFSVPQFDKHISIMNKLKTMGYNYKTQIFWVKTGYRGKGDWFENQVDIMMIFVKGKIEAFNMSLSNVVIAPIGKQYYVPEQFRNLIERATSSMNKRKMIELFAQSHAKNWDSWGSVR